VKIWNDPDFQGYSRDGKLMFMYLFTNPEIGESGLYVITPKTIKDATGIRLSEVESLLGGRLKNVHYDTATSTVFVAKALLYNRGGRADLKRSAIENERGVTSSPLWELFDQIYSFDDDDKVLVKGLETVGEGLTITNPITIIKTNPIIKPKIIKEEIGVEAAEVINKTIAELEKLSSWPRDDNFRENETAVLAELITEYPKVDPAREAKNLRTWLSERPIPKNPNYLNRLRNWFRKAEEFRVGENSGKTSGKKYGGAGVEL